jgi:ATP-dependent Clp protease ATP-binding subunit ClpA
MRKRPPEELIPGTLEKYSHDLTALAQQGQFAPLQRREAEVERVFQVLARSRKNNPMLIGEDNAERFAIIAEVARRISSGEIPEDIPFRRVVALDLEALIAGTTYRGDFEQRLKSVFAEIRQAAEPTLLFVDKLHRLIGAGPAEGAIDVANILIPALSRGEVCIIGTSTLDDYRKYVERDQALQRRFQEIIVRELSE